MRPFLSVIVPAYNEERRLPATLAVVQDYLERAPWAWELIVADDGSRDATVEVARAAFRSDRCRVSPAPHNQGKGAAVRRGMLEARGRFRLFTDADNSTPIEEVGRLLRRMRRTGAEVAIASRAKRGARIEKHQPWHRELMGRTFNGIVQLLAVPGIQDTQCGFKLFRAEAAREIFRRQTLDGFSFDVEVLLLARRLGFEIVEVPVRWIDHPDSRVSPLKDSARVFRDVLTVRWRHRGLGA